MTSGEGNFQRHCGKGKIVSFTKLITPFFLRIIEMYTFKFAYSEMLPSIKVSASKCSFLSHFANT